MFRLLMVMLLGLLLLAGEALAGVNINTASAGELETLPGIGPSKAQAIIAFRDEHGPFASVSALDDVPGIGPATLANISPLVTVDGASAPAPTAQRAEAPSGSEGPSTTGRININTASDNQLQELPGIGPGKAAAILADRQEKGPYKSCEELDRVSGIGPATVAALIEHCTAE